jgi:hypothetical protein
MPEDRFQPQPTRQRRLCRQCGEADRVRFERGRLPLTLRTCRGCGDEVCQHFSPLRIHTDGGVITECQRCRLAARERKLLEVS